MSDKFVEPDPFFDADPFDPYAEIEREAVKAQQPSDDETKRARLDARRRAYSRVFSGKGDEADVEAVMLDLAWFCRAFTTTFHPDPRAHALGEGRREVFLRIADHVGLDIDTLFVKYHKRNPS